MGTATQRGFDRIERRRYGWLTLIGDRAEGRILAAVARESFVSARSKVRAGGA